VRKIPEYDTCYYWRGEACVFDGFCPHRGPERECLAEDKDLLTYEDYLQERQIRNE